MSGGSLKSVGPALPQADNDLAVVHFSGHGAMVDHKLYLLPVEVDARDDAGIQANGLSADDLKGELLELAKYGRVLVLLDACHPARRR